jgi:hypothetical protein
MKSFKKFLTEAPGGPPKGGLEVSGIHTLGFQGYSDNQLTAAITPSIASASKVSSNLNNPTPSINGFALSNDVIGALGVMNIGLNPEDFNSAMAMMNTAQSQNIHNSYSKDQVKSLINPMFRSLQQQGGMSPEEAQQVADALIIGGFKLDQVYDQMLKVYMEQLKSLGKQASPGMAATLLGAQSYYDRATRELGVPQRYVDLHTKPVPGDKDIKDMGLYTPAQQGMPGM